MKPIMSIVALLLCGCASDELALVAADQNAQLARADADEHRAFVLAADARQRESLDRELDLVAKLGESEIGRALDRRLAAAAEPDAAASRRVVAVETVAAMLSEQDAIRAATSAAIAAKRVAITKTLDDELRRWIDDPKARQRERVAAALAVYARQKSEFARFVNDTATQLGVPRSVLQ